VLKLADIETVGKLLCLVEVVDCDEGIVHELVVDASSVQRGRQPIVTIEIELQAKGTPSGYAEVTEAVLRIDEVEVVVETLARIRLEEGLVRLLVVPRLVRLTRLHCAQDAHQSRLRTALRENPFDDRLLSHLAPAQELDLDAVVCR
jgi:hypothetical protein